MKYISHTALFLLISTFAFTNANAQQFVFPKNGQSAEQQQQQQDEYSCHSWAVGKTDVDPTRPQALILIDVMLYLTLHSQASIDNH